MTCLVLLFDNVCLFCLFIFIVHICTGISIFVMNKRDVIVNKLRTPSSPDLTASYPDITTSYTKCITFGCCILHCVVLVLAVFMDFIPFACEPLNGNNGNNRRVEDSGGIKKKRPVDDPNQVGRLVVFAFCRFAAYD